MRFVPTEINIGSMTITNTDHGGTISFGSTVVVNRNVSAKKSQGTGQQFADNCPRFSTISMVLDDDMMDVPGQKINK
jgi:hypothetical protein